MKSRRMRSSYEVIQIQVSIVTGIRRFLPLLDVHSYLNDSRLPHCSSY